MSTALCGERRERPGNDSTRTPINIDRDVKEELRDLLHAPYMRGVGFSEFIRRAVTRAREEADEHGLDGAFPPCPNCGSTEPDCEEGCTP